MNTVLPIVVIVMLGGLSGVALHRLKWPFLIRSGVAALLATVVWVSGTCLLLWAIAPDEKLGSLLPGPIFMTFLTALLPALLISRLSRT